MSYIGVKPKTAYDSVRKDRFTGQTGTTVTLSYAVSSVNDILVWVNGVKQDYTNYSVSSTTLTLGGTLVSSDIVEVAYLGRTYGSVVPNDGSVGTSALQDNAVTAAKLSSTAVDNTNINSTLITAQTEKTSLVDADKFLISDSAASGALKYVQKSNLPSGGMTLVGQSVDTTSGGTTYSGVSFDDVFSATYDNYLIVASFTTETDGDNVRMRFREGGSDLTGSSYIYSFREHNINTSNSGSFSSGGVSGQSYIDITSSQTNHISNHATLFGYVFLPFVNDARTQFMFQSNGYTNGNAIKNRNTAAKYNTAHNTSDGFTLYAESGNIDEHSIQIFGIHKS